MSIEIMKDQLNQLSKNNIVRLLTDILLNNIQNIYDFKPTQMYYRDDVVYRYDEIEKKHKLLVCNKNVLAPGNFNPDDWDVYTVSSSGNSIILESEFVATVDNMTNCPINQPLFDAQKDTLIVYHSVWGRLLKSKHWTLGADGMSIDLDPNYTLMKNQSLTFEVIK